MVVLDWDTIINTIILGFSAGMGGAVGSYIANKHVISNWESLSRRFDKLFKKLESRLRKNDRR